MNESAFKTLRATKISVNALHAIIECHKDILNKNGNLKLSELAGKKGATTATIARIAHSIANRRLARRLADPSDRRIVHLEPTSRDDVLAESLCSRTLTKS